MRMNNLLRADRHRIIGSRRRRPDSAPPGGRDRAQTPQRRKIPGSSGGTGGGLSSGGGIGGLGGLGGLFSGGGTGSGSGIGGSSGFPALGRSGCLSGRAGCIIIGIIILGIIILGAIFLMQCPGDFMSLDQTETQSPVVSQPAGQDDTMTMTTSPSISSAPTQIGQKWLVMLYQDADDRILEKDICVDLNEAEKAGPSDRVKIVAQIDRYNGSYSGDGNWTGTKRFLIGQDDNLGQLTSREVANLGELNMSSGQTLIDFATWAIQSYPADKYVLILSDHGMGWPGGWSDSMPKGRSDSNIPMVTRMGDLLYLNELDNTLGQIRSRTGIDKFELVGLDACLMGQLEVFTALEPHAQYAVASEEVEPSLGWAYTGFLQALNQNPDMSGAELGRTIVESYIDDDQRIVDRSARADFLSQGSPLTGLFGQSSDTSSQQLAREVGKSTTLTAVDLAKINVVNSSLNQLAYMFQNAKQQDLAGSRTYAQSFTSIFGSQVPPSYIDLGNFLQIVKKKNSNAGINQTADAVLTAISQAVIVEKHGAQKPGATGIAIYFPNSQLYQNSVAGAQSYTAIANRFATQSLWDDFLAYHYTGRQFTANDTQAVVPSSGLVRAPAAGGITISPVTASSSEAAPRQPVTLSADISGENVGYIYLFAGFYDRQANSIFVADQDYIESPDTRMVKGVYYPDWGQGDFTLDFSWEPVVFAINDGTISVAALFKPESYGGSYEEAVYTVDGTYTYTDSGEQCQARLYFSDEVLRKVLGFTGESEAAAPREITPNVGDKFTVAETWLDLDSSGEVINTAYQEGGTLTFGKHMFTWKTLDAAAGDYMVGFVVEDLDGYQQQSLTQIVVK